MADHTPTPHEAGQLALAEITKSSLRALRLAVQNLREGEATSGAAKRLRENAILLSKTISHLAAAAERTPEKVVNGPPADHHVSLDDATEFLRRMDLHLRHGLCRGCGGILPDPE